MKESFIFRLLFFVCLFFLTLPLFAQNGTASSKGGQASVGSRLEVLEINNGQSGARKILLEVPWRIDAPFWTPDGKWILFSSRGSIYRLSSEGGTPCRIDTGSACRCNNDNIILPNGKFLAVSDGSLNRSSQIYVVPFEGGKPRLVTPNYPSYLHGCSPDGKILTYTAMRNGGDGEIYTIPIENGVEKRLTFSKGLDDGSEFSPDGHSIYFCSSRSGKMQIWKMNTDGTSQKQITHSENNLWFPHISPDNKWLVFLAYQPEIDCDSHPANKDVELQIQKVGSSEIRTLTKLFGGQGTINVNSWSPDSKKIAFISYF